MIACWSALLIASLAAVGTVPAAATAQQAQTLRPCEKLYAVVHRVTVDEEGRVTETAVEHVVDPARGRTAEEAAANPIQMDLPPAYLAAARSLAAADDVTSGLKTVILGLCASEGWDTGRYFRVDEAAGGLRYITGEPDRLPAARLAAIRQMFVPAFAHHDVANDANGVSRWCRIRHASPGDVFVCDVSAHGRSPLLYKHESRQAVAAMTAFSAGLSPRDGNRIIRGRGAARRSFSSRLPCEGDAMRFRRFVGAALAVGALPALLIAQTPATDVGQKPGGGQRRPLPGGGDRRRRVDGTRAVDREDR